MTSPSTGSVEFHQTQGSQKRGSPQWAMRRAYPCSILSRENENTTSPGTTFAAPCDGNKSVPHMAGARFPSRDPGTEILVKNCTSAELRPNLEKVRLRCLAWPGQTSNRLQIPQLEEKSVRRQTFVAFAAGKHPTSALQAWKSSASVILRGMTRRSESFCPQVSVSVRRRCPRVCPQY